jgi:hypothetical protein
MQPHARRIHCHAYSGESAESERACPSRGRNSKRGLAWPAQITQQFHFALHPPARSQPTRLRTREPQSFAKVFAIRQRANTNVDQPAAERSSGSLHGNESRKLQRCLPTLAQLLLMPATRCLLNCNRRVLRRNLHISRENKECSEVLRRPPSHGFACSERRSRRTLSRRPQRMTCMTLHLHPSPPPRLAAKHKSPCARDQQAHTTTYLAPTFLHRTSRIIVQASQEGSKNSRTADDDVVPAPAFSSGLPRERRTQTMSEASLVFPDINGECT